LPSAQFALAGYSDVAVVRRPEALLDGLSFIVDLHHDTTVLEFFEVRRILEPAGEQRDLCGSCHDASATDTLGTG
jgi:hypothetical protein